MPSLIKYATIAQLKFLRRLADKNVLAFFDIQATPEPWGMESAVYGGRYISHIPPTTIRYHLETEKKHVVSMATLLMSITVYYN